MDHERIARDVQIALAYEEALEAALNAGTLPPSIPAFVAQALPAATVEERAAVSAFLAMNLELGELGDELPDPVPPEVWARIQARIQERLAMPAASPTDAGDAADAA